MDSRESENDTPFEQLFRQTCIDTRIIILRKKPYPGGLAPFRDIFHHRPDNLFVYPTQRKGVSFDTPLEQTGEQMSDIQIVEQKFVKLYDDELLAVRANDSQVYVAINQMCAALGIAAPMQRRRIRDHEILNEGYVIGTVLTEGGKQQASLLRVDLVPLWLIGIQINSVREDVKPKLKLFIQRAANVLAEAFQGGRLTADPGFEDLLRTDTPAAQAYKMAAAIMKMAQQQLMLEAQLSSHATQLAGHEQRLEEIESALGDPRRFVTPDQAMQISQAIKTIATEIQKQTKQNEYAKIYGQMYRQFGITSYKQLPASKFDQAMAWLTDFYCQITGATGDELPF
ncbi:MAG: phage antirepressor N-terminal domain-containing protein [Chloroflexota bacterium]